jgi:hypothetical protein
VNGHAAHVRVRWVRCKAKRCAKCPHGPYLYHVWREGGRTRERYVGRDPAPRPRPAPSSGRTFDAAPWFRR